MPRIPIEELRPGMVVYYCWDYGDYGNWDDVLTIDTSALVVVRNGKLLLSCLHRNDEEAERDEAPFYDPESWNPYSSQDEANLAGLRAAAELHRKELADIERITAAIEARLPRR